MIRILPGGGAVLFAAGLNGTGGIAFDPGLGYGGFLWVSEFATGNVRSLGPNGVPAAPLANVGPGVEGIAFGLGDPAFGLAMYTANLVTGTIDRITPAGVVLPFANTATGAAYIQFVPAASPYALGGMPTMLLDDGNATWRRPRSPGRPSPRSGIMAGMAQVAIADDASAIFWNPAALAFISCQSCQRSAASTHAELPGVFGIELHHAFAGFSTRIGEMGGGGAGITYFRYPESVLTDFSGTVTGTITPNEVVPGVAFGGRVSETMGVGAGLKLVRVDFGPHGPDGEDAVASTLAADLGFLWREPRSRVSLGGNVQHLGLGLGPGLRVLGVSFDYASAPFGVDENLANRFSLGACF